MLHINPRLRDTSSTMSSQRAAALLAMLATLPMTAATPHAATPQFVVSHPKSALSSEVSALSIREPDSDAQLASDLHALFKRIAASQSDVEDEYLPALYEDRAALYRLF
ncbi:hypothetical protein [Mesorhizobium sp. B2-8-5]|uniref:hypothetical protein n=1 Tax=Mesorhizobium sp. B2-8-5 TaxID=2589903 RepID=UPI00112ECEEA|nr:hypothetical protein [Mesorhizobium sp. B2-8-5]UCI24614.1 hypothetical protein FJ430_23915 [Mesorhizobium sp. B2-8-5]